MRKQVLKIVGVNHDGNLVIVDEFFSHESHTGASGYIMEPLSQQTIDENNSDEKISDYLIDIWKEAVKTGNTLDGFETFKEDFVAESNALGHLFVGDDDSFRSDTEKAWNALTPKERSEISEALGCLLGDEECVTFNCVSCGRIFDTDMLSFCLNPKLYEVILKFESTNKKMTEEEFETITKGI